MITLWLGIMLCLGNTYAVANQSNVDFATNIMMREIRTSTITSKNDGGWIEIGDVSMSAYYDESWHWATATLYRIEDTSLAYKVRYEDRFYTVKVTVEGGSIKCSVLIPYQGEKRWFSFTIPCR